MAVGNLHTLRYGGFGCYHATLNTNWQIMNPGAAMTALPTLSSGEALEIVSDNAADTAAGNGAKTILAIYMDANDYSIDSATITLNGTSAVALADTSIARMLGISVMSYGASGPSMGNITVRVASAGANRITIPVGHSRAAPGRTTIQTAYAGYYNGFRFSNATQTSLAKVEYRIVADINPYTGALNEGVFQEIDWGFAGPASGQIGYNISWERGGPSRIELPPRCTVMALAKSDVANVAASGFVFLETQSITG